jgi:hypothetical protein
MTADHERTTPAVAVALEVDGYLTGSTAATAGCGERKVQT